MPVSTPRKKDSESRIQPAEWMQDGGVRNRQCRALSNRRKRRRRNPAVSGGPVVVSDGGVEIRQFRVHRCFEPSMRFTTMQAFQKAAQNRQNKTPSPSKGNAMTFGLKEWSGRRDLNPRPSAPKADALPGCATPRKVKGRHLTTPAHGCQIGISRNQRFFMT